MSDSELALIDAAVPLLRAALFALALLLGGIVVLALRRPCR